MEFQYRLKTVASLVAVLGVIAGAAAWAQPVPQDLTPVLELSPATMLMEESLQAPVPGIPELDPITPLIPQASQTPAFQVETPAEQANEAPTQPITAAEKPLILEPSESSVPAEFVSPSELSVRPAASTTPSQQKASQADPAGKPERPNCHMASQLDLTHNQMYRLKHSKKTFELDNKAAFDSLRIKRNLLKRLGNPESEREKQQAEQLRQEVTQELQALKKKREAQIEHYLSSAQYEKLRAMRTECQPQAQPSAIPGRLFNKNTPEKQMDKTIRNIPRKTF